MSFRAAVDARVVGLPPGTLAMRPAGFSLVEALVAISITAMAGAVLLMAIETAVSSSNDSTQAAIAQGLAQQLVDEVLGTRYMSINGNPYQYPLSPSSSELNAGRREAFDDTDDFHQFSARPAEDRWAVPIGQENGAGGLRHPNFRLRPNYFDNWQQDIEVYYVDPNDLSRRLSGRSTSNYRAVEARISRLAPDGTLRELARVRRVYAYLPEP